MLKDKKVLFLTVLFIFFLGFWILINVFENKVSNLEGAQTLFTNTYGMVALFGGIFALLTAKRWGGFRSLMGKSIGFFGLGLLAQELGQLMYAYYVYVKKVEVPYPSLGDIGYFGSVLLYITAIYLLFKVCGSRLALSSSKGKLQILFIPLILGISYVVFLKGYDFASTPLLTSLLDFGYPLLQAIYLALAVLTFTLSRKYLGGLMRPAILLVLIALTIQYFADFSFLYQVKQETWAPAGTNDLIYLVSYFTMGFSLLRFESVTSKMGGETNGQ